MATKGNTINQISGVKRNASEPFVIRFTDGPYRLTREQLFDQADAPMPGKKKWDCPALKFISFENSTLKFLTRGVRTPEFEITVRIDPDKLCVSCNCGQLVEKLCIHALMSLERIVWYEHYHIPYFERYRPGGPVETGLKHPELFSKDFRNVTCNFTPKKHLGHVYKLSGNTHPARFTNILNEPGPSNIALPPNNTALIYVLLFSNVYWQKMPPFLLPCVSIKNKAGTAVKGFEKFLISTGQNDETYPTEEQKSMVGLCHKMLHQAKITNRRFLENGVRDRNRLRVLFSLWEKVVPSLEQQKYVYSYLFYQIRHLKNKPVKSRMRRITVKNERPRLFFQLADKGDYYILNLKVSIGGKTTSSFNSDYQFFIEYKDCYYLVASPRDVGVLEWMHSKKNRITIFKEQFEEFETMYLTALREHYQVEH